MRKIIKRISLLLVACILGMNLAACSLSESDIKSILKIVSILAEDEEVTVTSPEDENRTSVIVSNTSVSKEKENDFEVSDYKFRNSSLLNQHYDKHGKDMGFASAAEYEKAANIVISNPQSLHKIESEDGDDVYYLEATNEFVILSKDGYIRTYFLPDAGIAYYNRQ